MTQQSPVFKKPDDSPHEVSASGLLMTGLALVVVVGLSWLLILLREQGTLPGLKEPWIAGAAVMLTGIIAFFGVYASVGEIRVAMAAGLFFTWLVLNAYAFSIESLASFITSRKEFWDTLRAFTTSAISFYFAAEALIQSVKVYQAGKITSETIRRTGVAPDPVAVRAALNVDGERPRRRR